MPEMPEVETTRRSLQKLVGLTVKKIRFSKLAPIETTSAAKIRRHFDSANIAALHRRGKYLLIKNKNDHALVIHLGMSGQLRFFEESVPVPAKHTHLEIHFDNLSVLRFIDARRFGTLSLSTQPNHGDNPFLTRLGPDYDDENLKTKTFIERCRRHPKLSLKSLALNQSVATGLGNIYACESLYLAKLDPRRLVAKTSDKQLTCFLESARQALAQGVHFGGVSMRDYLNGLGHRGVMQDFLQVYDREGKPALDGSGMVKRIVQNARSTFFVPKVQK